MIFNSLCRPAVRELPKFKINGRDLDGNGIPDDEEGPDNEEAVEKSLPVEFSDKTNQLLDYIEKTYLKGMVGAAGDGKNILEKMKLAENSQKAKAMDYGFDNIFAEGPTPTPGAMEAPLEHLGELSDSQYLQLAQDDVDGRFSSMSNVDGMNV